MPQQQSSMPSRRSVAKGAAWTAAPILIAVAPAPAFAASLRTITTDLTVSRRFLSGALYPTYRFGNAGPRVTNLPAIWTMQIVQTNGNKSADYIDFETIDNDEGTRFLLGPATHSINGSGYKVTTQTLTLVQGFSPTGGDIWVDIYADFKFTGAGLSGRWTIAMTPNFTDVNTGNTVYSGTESPL